MNPDSTSAKFVKFIPDRNIGGFTAHVPDVPAYGEGDTKKGALLDLNKALRGYVDTFGIDVAVGMLREAKAADLKKILDEGTNVK